MADPSWLAWNVPESEFPHKGTVEEKLRFALEYAVLAPSGHNTQPWLFRIEADRVNIYADRTRALPVIDPDDRELAMSCAAAAFHLSVALRYFGFAASIELLPNRSGPDLLARVIMGEQTEASDTDQQLFHAILHRRTNRMTFENRPVGEELLSTLQDAAAAHGACLHVFWNEADRLAVADLVARGDHLQLADQRFRQELAAWIHPTRDHSRDGIPSYAAGLDELQSGIGPLILRTFDAGRGHAAKDRQLALGSPVLAVLSTDGETIQDWLAAGLALDHLLLRACADGLSASYLNQPIELQELRSELRNLMKSDGHPQLLLRLGYGPVPPPTPRRPVQSVLLHS